MSRVYNKGMPSNSGTLISDKILNCATVEAVYPTSIYI